MTNKGFVSFNILVVVALVVMVSVWLLTTPKLNLLQNLPNLPILTNQKAAQPTNQQNSSVAQKPVVDKQAVSKLSVQQINSPSDLGKVDNDLGNTNVDSIDTAIDQMDTNF